MKYLKDNVYLILIIVLAIFLRFNIDIFIPGYNYDEIAIMGASVQSFPFGIINYCATVDYHAPLYQLIAHFFTFLRHEWFYLRLLNLVISIFNVFVFYKIGCLLKNKKLGCILALLLCVNHLEITTVSFIKFYCMGFCLFSWSLYYFIKILKKDTGYNKFAVLNIFFILLSTHAFIYVGLEYLFLLFIKKDKIKVIKSGLLSLAGFGLYLPVLVKQMILNHQNIFSPHSDYSGFSMWSLYNAFNDYTGPLLNYCCNNITMKSFVILLEFIQSIQNRSPNWFFLIEFVIFSLNVVIICIYFLVIGIIKDKTAKQLAIVNFSYLFIYFIITKLELTGLVPIYLFTFALNMLVCIGLGVINSNKKTAIIMFSYLILVNLFITNCYPLEKRWFNKGKIYYVYEEYFKTHPNSTTIVTEGGRFLKGYYKNRNIIDFDKEKMSGMYKKDMMYLIFGEKINGINKKNAKDVLAPLILNHYRSHEFEEYFKKNVYDKLNKGEEIVFSFVSDDNSPFLANSIECEKALKTKPYKPILSKVTISEGLKEENDYIDTLELADILSSYNYEYLIDLMEKYFERIKFEQYTTDSKGNYIKTFEDYTEKYTTLWLAKNTSKSWIFVTYKKR